MMDDVDAQRMLAHLERIADALGDLVRPSYIHKPKLRHIGWHDDASVVWIATFGIDEPGFYHTLSHATIRSLEDAKKIRCERGIVGFGRTPSEAISDFDAKWWGTT